MRGHQYLIYILNPEDALIFLQALKILEGKALVHELVIQRNCCKRAFIRGIFLACGSVTDPERGYHLEMAVGTIGKAEELVQILADFQIPAKVVERKKNYIVYIKEGALIVDLLNVMEAHVALMEFENVRILKEMRNSVNRQVNCETANIKKTVTAATRQIEDTLCEGNNWFWNPSEGVGRNCQTSAGVCRSTAKGTRRNVRSADREIRCQPSAP